MLTQLDDLTLIRYGARYRTRYLLEQARYTLKLALSEEPPLELPGGYLARVEEAIGRVEATRDDREFAAVESKLATGKQNRFAEEARTWRRKVTARARRAASLGATIPRELLTTVRTSSVPKLAENVSVMLLLLAELSEELACAGDVQPLIETGRAIHERLVLADAEQEHKRFAELPESVRSLYRERGELYVALKVIHEAGREQYASDPHKASRYTLNLLYRRAYRLREATEATEAKASEGEAGEAETIQEATAQRGAVGAES